MGLISFATDHYVIAWGCRYYARFTMILRIISSYKYIAPIIVTISRSCTPSVTVIQLSYSVLFRRARYASSYISNRNRILSRCSKDIDYFVFATTKYQLDGHFPTLL